MGRKRGSKVRLRNVDMGSRSADECEKTLAKRVKRHVIVVALKGGAPAALAVAAEEADP